MWPDTRCDTEASAMAKKVKVIDSCDAVGISKPLNKTDHIDKTNRTLLVC